MIAVWMLYCVGIGVAFVVVGFALERALHFASRSTRWAWVIALLGSYAMPITAWLRPDAFATFGVHVPTTIDPPSIAAPATPSVTSITFDRPLQRSLSLSDLDSPLRWAWGIGSLAIVLVVATAGVRLAMLRRHWRHVVVDGKQVLLSHDVGPAVVGLWSPRVVLPEWVLQLPERERALMHAHEEQHVRAGDPALLAAALLTVLFAPWNLALWWQWRRLRLAVEIDCDARVLRRSDDASAYGELLLRVGAYRRGQLLGVAAFGQPGALLESRIRRMLSRTPRWRWAGVAAATLVALGAIVGACETPRPLSPLRDPQEVTAASSDIHGVVRQAIKADKTIQALRPPAVAYVWYQATRDGRIIATGREDSRVSLLRHAAALGTIKTQGFAPAGILAPVKVVYAWVEISGADAALAMTDRMSIRDGMGLRSWVDANARKMFPSILEPTGPSMDAFLVHDSQLHVYRSALVTMYYLNGERPSTEISMRELQQVLPSYSLNDGWSVIDPRGLRGLVRDNVRVIRINHDPQPQDTAQRTPGAVDTAAVIRQAEQLRRLARQYQPEVFGRLTPPTAVALVMDARGSVLGHAARTRVIGNDVRTADGVAEDCLEVLTRLLPRFKEAQWSQTGCTNDPQPNVVIYWGIALHP